MSSVNKTGKSSEAKVGMWIFFAIAFADTGLIGLDAFTSTPIPLWLGLLIYLAASAAGFTAFGPSRRRSGDGSADKELSSANSRKTAI